MPDYRDPKVTTTEGKSNNMMKWLGIALAVLLALLLLGWLLGWFADEDAGMQTTDPAVVEEPVVTEPAVDEPVVVE